MSKKRKNTIYMGGFKSPADRGQTQTLDGQIDEVVQEAIDRFNRCESWEKDARILFREDLRFANADADNGFQWPDTIKSARETDRRPCLTINKVRQHNLNIINDTKQNKPAIKFIPSGGQATVKAAQILNAIMRKIEYQSKAQTAYDHATAYQVQAGVGYLRVCTDYVDARSFDQDIFIKSVPDPLMVYIDPDAKEPDKSDMKFAFIFEDLPIEEFKSKYPKFRKEASPAYTLGNSTWIDKDRVRIVEYFRIVEEEDQILETEDGEIIWQSQVGKELFKATLELAEGDLPTRRVTQKVVEWKLIVGNKVIEENVFPGTYIPIVPVVGEEVIIDGKLDRKGHTRAMKDPQRMYNYWSSMAVEYGGLQTKTPWIAAKESIEGFEDVWANANQDNRAFLPYRGIGENGETLLPPPSRVDPPVAAPVAVTAMQIAQQEMESVSGQFVAQMGQQSNERTGAALHQRQMQGDRATYHYMDNLAKALRQIGQIVLDIIPIIYDTERVMSVMGEDGENFEVTINPAMPQAAQASMDPNTGKEMDIIFNPQVGNYMVMASVGPAYATRREQAFEAFTLMLTQSPQLTSVVGDLMFRAADFPLAAEAAERLKKMVPPQALGQGPTQNEMMLQQQVKNLTNLVQELVGQLHKGQLKDHAQEEKNQISEYDAITKRLGVLLKDQQADKSLLLQAISEALATPPGMDQPETGDDALARIQAALPGGQPVAVPGLRRDPDGNWQMREPGGTYAPVGPLFDQQMGGGQ
jgi:hypothetical protein